MTETRRQFLIRQASENPAGVYLVATVGMGAMAGLSWMPIAFGVAWFTDVTLWATFTPPGIGAFFGLFFGLITGE